jgi:methylase of polypeptide subunit release factors
VIYVDTSVVLAQLLAEDRKPPPTLWDQTLVSSRLLEYEAWTRLHARRLASSHGEGLRELLGRISFLELHPLVLERALTPFPTQVRTVDALHLSSIEFLRARRTEIRLATYDARMTAAARRLKIAIEDV